MTAFLLILILALLGCSAFASASETALFSLSAEQSGKDERIAALLDDREYTLATILIVNNLVNISIVILSAAVIEREMTFRSVAQEFLFTSVVVTFVLLLFGEILPKVFANYNNARVARFCAPGIGALKRLTRPAAWLLVATGSRVKGRSRENLSLDQLSEALDVTQSASEEEKQILEGIVSFAGREVGQIMRPRLDMTALDADATFDEVKRVIIESGFSRIPVYEENIDHIRGVLFIKDVVPHIGAGADFEWQRLIRRAHFIPEHKKIDDLLEEFQVGRRHLAIVADEYGSTLGLVTLEDILEEIVGEISDESDAEGEFFTRTGEGEWLFDGKTHLSDAARVLGVTDDFFDSARGEAETLAGLMLEIRHGFLKKGETIDYQGFTFTVQALAGRRIDKIRVKNVGLA